MNNLKKGTYQLHSEPNFNFQMNRTIMWGNGDIVELKNVAPKINSTEDWVKEISNLAKIAEDKHQIPKAIGYYRMSEFFEEDYSPNKLNLYRKSRELFYKHNEHLFKTTIIKDNIDYENGSLPVWVCKPESEIKDTVILHGGNDSYMEEFLPTVLYFLSKKIAVYVFDGPGQGEALRESNIHYTYKWEKPISKIIKKYHLNDVTIIGISLGGMLAPRAAAFNPEIKRVVAWGIMPNFYDVVASKAPKLLGRLINLKLKFIINPLLKLKMQKEPLSKWGIAHGIYSMNVKTPYDYVRNTKKFEMESIGHKITQDFLLLGSNEDHFIPIKLYKKVIDALPNVSSLTYKMYTKKDSAENHCNVGNTELILDDITDWISKMKE